MPSTTEVSVLAGCVPPSLGQMTGQSPSTFNPVRAFAGRSHGNGTLTVIFQAPQPFHVESHGHAQSDGKIRLDQIVTFAGRPPEKRYWLLKKTSPANYEGTLSEAVGPVTGHTEGAQFELVYALPGGLNMHQTLTLEPSGKIIDNTGSITFLGIQIGALNETIEREQMNDLPGARQSRILPLPGAKVLPLLQPSSASMGVMNTLKA